MRFLIFVHLFFMAICTHGQLPELKPWEKPDRAIIIDAYGPNAIIWDTLQKDTTVVGIIHKATDGLTRFDDQYPIRREEAKKRGYLWGSYHLARKGDPIEEAKFYLSTIKPDSTELMALDMEGLDTSKFMSLENAKKFILYVYWQTGRYPAVYMNHSVLKEICTNYSNDTVFKKCVLWYARFKNTITDFPQNVWPEYTLWQFSCEINCKKQGECPYNVPGTRFDMDINVYNGTKEELRKKWPF